MTALTNYFAAGPAGTISLRPGSNLSYKGEYLRVYDNTEIDKWFVGDFSSANYFITVEFDSNNKETLQVLVVARPGHASLTVYGRTSIDAELITVDAVVNNSWVSLVASPADPIYAGARISCFATYAETLLPLTSPITISGSGPGGGSGGGGSGGPAVVPSFGVVAVTGQQDILASSVTDIFRVAAGAGIGLTTNPTTKTLTISSSADKYSNIAVTGSETLTASSPTSTLTLTAGSGITLSSSQISDTVTISANTSFSSLTVNGLSTLSNVSVGGSQTIGGTLGVTGLTTLQSLTVQGNLTVNGITTTVNSASLDINDVNITLGRGAVAGEQVSGGGISLEGAFASILWDNANTAWSVNKNLIPNSNNSLTLGNPLYNWTAIYANTISGTLTTPTQTNITAVGILNSLTVLGAISNSSNISTTGNINATGSIVSSGNISGVNGTFTGLLDVTSSIESVIDVVSGSSVNYSLTLGAVFYHSTSPTIDWVANFTNIPITNGKAITINIIVPQGPTAYKISGCQIDGASQTVKWAGSSTPTGNSSKTDIWAFSLIRRSGAWVVLGSQSPNFG